MQEVITMHKTFLEAFSVPDLPSEPDGVLTYGKSKFAL